MVFGMLVNVTAVMGRVETPVLFIGHLGGSQPERFFNFHDSPGIFIGEAVAAHNKLSGRDECKFHGGAVAEVNGAALYAARLCLPGFCLCPVKGPAFQCRCRCIQSGFFMLDKFPGVCRFHQIRFRIIFGRAGVKSA